MSQTQEDVAKRDVVLPSEPPSHFGARKNARVKPYLIRLLQLTFLPGSCSCGILRIEAQTFPTYCN